MNAIKHWLQNKQITLSRVNPYGNIDNEHSHIVHRCTAAALNPQFQPSMPSPLYIQKLLQWNAEAGYPVAIDGDTSALTPDIWWQLEQHITLARFNIAKASFVSTKSLTDKATILLSAPKFGTNNYLYHGIGFAALLAPLIPVSTVTYDIHSVIDWIAYAVVTTPALGIVASYLQNNTLSKLLPQENTTWDAFTQALTPAAHMYRYAALHQLAFAHEWQTSFVSPHQACGMILLHHLQPEKSCLLVRDISDNALVKARLIEQLNQSGAKHEELH